MTLVMNESYADRRLPHHRNPKEFVPLDHLADLEWCEGESGSKFSSPVTESNSQDSSLIALKLGRLADSKNGQNGQHSKERSTRAGIKGSYSHTPTRQVLVCNMDLSSSKDYHKRHIVCDTHSKTPKAIVNGIEVNVTPSEEKTVDEEPLVFANKQAKNAFTTLLESANVHSDWTWEQTIVR
ncbi:squamosa promoter-binding-like protein 12 [Prunus avium]|uniref:Squamosa promoter-binding-like protein 12 n=1 Tax=Prunus avium TaxID=42229 RepID=A0A6P5STL5_PRUAV|nr:squamosa promoter-binding-like protein 12 [Prunus avium]